MTKRGLVIDLLSLDSMLALLVRGYLRQYPQLGYCRITVWGQRILNLLPSSVRQRFQSYDDAFNEQLFDGERLTVLRERVQEQIADCLNLDQSERIARFLGVNETRLTDSFKVHASVSMYQLPEAILRARMLGHDLLCGHTLLSSELITTKVLYYRNRLDFSRIRNRPNYCLDHFGDLRKVRLNAWVPLFYYLLAMLLLPISYLLRRTSTSKSMDVAVEVLRNVVDQHSINDLYWMYDDNFRDRALLIENRSVRHVAEVEQMETMNIGVFQLSQQDFFLRDPAVCKTYLLTISLYLKLLWLQLSIPAFRVFILSIYKVLYYQAIFEARDIKVFTTNHSYLNAGPLLACDLSRTVYLRGCWSNQGFPSPMIATSADACFAWGDATVSIYSRSGANGVCFVKTGYISSHLVGLGSPDLGQKGLKCERQQVVLGYFDNLSSSDLFNTVADSREAFILLKRLLEAHEYLLIYYKPKSGDLLEVHKAGVYEQLLPFIEQGRLVVLEGARGASFIPVTLAGNLDLVLGFPISSAATEVAIANVPAFHLNLTGIEEHQWDLEGRDKFIFHDTDKAFEIIGEYIAMPERLANFDQGHNRYVNHFMDYRASERMQFFIEQLCQAQGTVDDKVKLAADAYRQEYCADTGCIHRNEGF